MRICMNEVTHAFPEVVAAVVSTPTGHYFGGPSFPAPITPFYFEKYEPILEIVSRRRLAVYR
jgi:hypothetical protein